MACPEDQYASVHGEVGYDERGAPALTVHIGWVGTGTHHMVRLDSERYVTWMLEHGDYELPDIEPVLLIGAAEGKSFRWSQQTTPCPDELKRRGGNPLYEFLRYTSGRLCIQRLQTWNCFRLADDNVVEIALDYSRTVLTRVDLEVFKKRCLWRYSWYHRNGLACAAVEVGTSDRPPRFVDRDDLSWYTLAAGMNSRSIPGGVLPSDAVSGEDCVWMAMHVLVLGLSQADCVAPPRSVPASTSLSLLSAVTHLSGKRLDNRLSNLQLMPGVRPVVAYSIKLTRRAKGDRWEWRHGTPSRATTLQSASRRPDAVQATWLHVLRSAAAWEALQPLRTDSPSLFALPYAPGRQVASPPSSANTSASS